MVLSRRSLGCVLFVFTACGTAGDDTPIVTVRDSAGVSIITLPMEPWTAGETWRLAAEPTTQIGVESGDSALELYDVNGVRRLSDGTIAISSYSTNDIRLFSPEGALVGRIGRSGRGPGEFMTLGGFEQLPGDTLLAIDFGRLALMAFTRAGELAWQRALDTGSCLWMVESWAARLRLPDGTFLLVCEQDDVWDRILAGETRPNQLDRSTALVLHFGEAGVPDTIARLPGREYAVIDGPGATYPPWGRTVAHSLTPDGLLIGTQDSFDVRRYTTHGRLVARIRAPIPDLTVTSDDMGRLRRAMLGRVRGDTAGAARAIDVRLATLPRPAARAAHGRVLYDDAGRIWISEAYHPLEPPVRWAVLLPDERRLVHLVVPPRFEIYEAGEDWVLGRWRDELGVEYVRLYALQQGSGQ